MNDTICLLFAVTIFVVTNTILKKFWRGSDIKIYEQALKDHTTVNGQCVKTWLDDRNTDNYQDDEYRATYSYTVNGKTYKKDLFYCGPSVVFYYDRKNPRRAVTKSGANSIDHTVKRFIVSAVVMLVMTNVVF